MYVLESVCSSSSVRVIDSMDLFDTYSGPGSHILIDLLLVIKCQIKRKQKHSYF